MEHLLTDNDLITICPECKGEVKNHKCTQCERSFIPLEKLRRKCRDALNKTESTENIIKIAEILGIELS